MTSCHALIAQKPVSPPAAGWTCFAPWERSALPTLARIAWRGVYAVAVLCATLCLLAACSAASAADTALVQNANFQEGSDQPEEWQLSGCGSWVDREILQVDGDGSDSSYWSSSVTLEPGMRYHFETRARRRGSGSAITGPGQVNRDQFGVTADWQWMGHVFRVPDSGGEDRLRLGHWQGSGAFQFDAVRLTPALAVHRQEGQWVLGEGESLRGDEYHFAGSFNHSGSNDHRVLHSARATFNSDRWVFGSGSEVVYRFALPGPAFVTAAIECDVNYHTRGACAVAVSRDGKTWRQLADREGVGMVSAQVPGDLLPADALFVRVAAEGPAGFQVNRLDFLAQLDRQVAEANGGTVYADVQQCGEEVEIPSLLIRRDPQSGEQVLLASVVNRSSTARVWTAGLEYEEAVEPAQPSQQQVPPGASARFELPVPPGRPGERALRLTIRDGERVALEARLTIRVPEFYRSDYGFRLAGLEGPGGIWWCDATRKIPRQRALPTAVSQAVQLEAASNDYEAAQVVLRPSEPLRGLTARATDLIGSGTSRIAGDNVQILRVYYHFVQHPTDSTGVRDWWPDALPPLDQPLDVPAGSNQPLWVLVHVPPETPPGDYAGSIRLAGEGFSADVPLQLHVWNFTLPATNHLETAFGLSPQAIWQYHGLKTDEDRRRVLDMYFRSFAEHRISPYDPASLDPIRVRFRPDEDPPRADLDFTDFDRAMEQAVSRYHFTSFRLGIQGMGGGTFHERHPPRIGEFDESTPQYRAMFSSYVSQLESHLREHQWLDKAYAYWFDEPAPNDYQFVADGMSRLKQYAPGLRRMLTEEPADNVLNGLIDIWCPISNNYDHDQAQKRRAAGDRFWWYVCTGPKAPYCTLFIDHPASELRVWHWQTWQREITGTLVWQSNYWTSSAAFPDQPQDPYEDPMGYVSGYSTPRGTKRHWGNGDGRFIYPPLAAAVPGKSGKDPVIAPPVSSIRWEMLREGVEDYETLYLLRELLDRQKADLSPEDAQRFGELLLVPEAITADMTTFTTCSEPIYQRRRAVAEAIEKLRATGGTR